MNTQATETALTDRVHATAPSLMCADGLLLGNAQRIAVRAEAKTHFAVMADAGQSWKLGKLLKALVGLTTEDILRRRATTVTAAGALSAGPRRNQLVFGLDAFDYELARRAA